MTASACATRPPAIPQEAPASLTQPCSRPLPLRKGASEGVLLKDDVQLAEALNQCADRENALAGWAKGLDASKP